MSIKAVEGQMRLRWGHNLNLKVRNCKHGFLFFRGIQAKYDTLRVRKFSPKTSGDLTWGKRIRKVRSGLKPSPQDTNSPPETITEHLIQERLLQKPTLYFIWNMPKWWNGRLIFEIGQERWDDDCRHHVKLWNGNNRK